MPGKGQIDWGTIGKPLEALLRHERELGHYEHAAYELLAAVVHGPSESRWRRFLLEGESFGSVSSQAIAISDADTVSPKAAVDSIRELVETAFALAPRKASSFLGQYLPQRPSFPTSVRERLDRLVKSGNRAIPLRAATLASEMRRLKLERSEGGEGRDVFGYWYEELLAERVTARQARDIPAQVRAAMDRLLEHLRDVDEGGSVDEKTVYERYSRLLKSRRVPAMVELTIRADRSRLKLGPEQLEQFLDNLPEEEALRRLARLGEWMDEVNVWINHDGVILTPKVTGYLSGTKDLESLLGELDQLREKTRNGRFRISNPLQRELEYKRFVSTCSSSFLHPSEYPMQLLLDPVPGPDEMRRIFDELRVLPPAVEEEYSPSERDLREVQRAAYEAAAFLEMLREFRAQTSRDIMVVGNDRYGRQWVVEPIEDYLDEAFTVRYARAYSGASMRMTIPSPFPREVAKEIGERMPHIVIVDGANWPYRNPYGSPRERRHNVMRSSRALRGYANWFVLFNDVRAEGDASKYQSETCLPANHIEEIRKWYRFATLRQELREWVGPGQTYGITMWAPLMEKHAMLGDVEVDVQPVELAGDRPLVVLANPNIYRDEGDDLPGALRGTVPHYFDEPNAHVKETVEFGFGPHGIETRVKGPTTASFVAVIQRHIREQIRDLIKGPSHLRDAL